MKFLFLLFALSAQAENLKYGNFGKFELFPAKAQADRLVIYFSGEKGWTKQSRALGMSLADSHTAVAAVNWASYAKTLRAVSKKCMYPAGDLELLSKYLQAHLKFKEYRPPLLVGQEGAAMLAYAAFAQAPKATFTSALSLGFCPEEVQTKQYCKGYGVKYLPKGKGFVVQPFEDELNGWAVIQGAKDCAPDKAEAFVKKVEGAAFVTLPGENKPRAPQWEAPLKEWAEKLLPAASPRVAAQSPDASELPLVTVPAEGNKIIDEFVVFYSGDGGWAGFDQALAGSLAEEGVPVVGLSTLKYFWKARTPEEAAKDLDSIIQTYKKTWKKSKVRLVGYSFGADVMPELASRLPAETRKMVKGVHLLGLSESAEFEFHFDSWLGGSGGGLPVKPSLEKIADLGVQCLYGEEEDDSLCAKIDAKKFRVVKMPGGHHFGGDNESLAKLILKEKT